MQHEKQAKCFLDLKLGNQPLVAGVARQAPAKEIVDHVLKRLAELRKQRQQEARKLKEGWR